MGRVVTVADKTTFIKLDRNIIYWRWFTTPKIFSIFVWLIVKANIKDGYFQKEKICRGSLITSNQHIAEGCGVTIQNVRTALSALEETGEISRNNRNHYQIITITNYEKYQSALSKTEGQITVRPINSDIPTNRQLTTNKEYKNVKNRRIEKNKEKTSPSPLNGVGDVPKAEKLLPIDEGTVDDIPEDYRDFCKTYADYWRFRNR